MPQAARGRNGSGFKRIDRKSFGEFKRQRLVHMERKQHDRDI